MSPPLTLENSLVLACVRTEPDVQRIRELVERCPAWPVIVRKAERWRVVPSVYLQLRRDAQSGRVPVPVAEGLKHLYYRDTVHGIVKRELLRLALLRFAEASVPVIVLKGAALATLVYQSHALRPTGRIKLLVHRRDLARVGAVIRSLREAPGALVGGRQRYTLLDVRHDIFGQHSVEEMPAAVGIPIEDFWTRARPVQIASVPTLVFSHEDLLLHLAMHLTADAFVGRLRTLCDIGEICKRYGDTIDWSQVIARACAYDLAKPLYYSLHLARELVGAGVPFQALMALRASFDQLPLEDRFIAASARRALLHDAQSPSRLATVTALGVRLLLTGRARDSVTIVGRRLARACEGPLRRLAARPDPSPSRGADFYSTNALRTRQATAHPTLYRPVHTQGHVGEPDDYLEQCSGVIHVGANEGQERDIYARHNLKVAWIEPIPEQFETLRKNIRSLSGQVAINALITDQDGKPYTFHVANNDGASSSILDLHSHKDIWPDVHYIRDMEMKSSTLKTALETWKVDPDRYDALVLDTQGSEMLVLQGAKDILRQFKFIKTEVADFEAYRNCASVDQLCSYLQSFGFQVKRKDRFAQHPSGGAYYDILFERV
jgi:FkbM family methyltransferase